MVWTPQRHLPPEPVTPDGHQELGLAAASNTSGGAGAQALWALPLLRAPGCCVLADQGHGRLSRPLSHTFSSGCPTQGAAGGPWGLSAELAEMMAGWGLLCQGLWPQGQAGAWACSLAAPAPPCPHLLGRCEALSVSPRSLIWGTLSLAGHANGCLFHTEKHV